MPKSIRRGLSDRDENTARPSGSAKPPPPSRSSQRTLLDMKPPPPGSKPAAVPFEAEEAQAVAPAKALLHTSLMSVASSADASYIFGDDDESSSFLSTTSSPKTKSKRKIYGRKRLSSTNELGGIAEALEEEKTRGKIQTADGKVILTDAERATTPGARAMRPAAAAAAIGSSQASVSTAGSSVPPPSSHKLRPQTVYYVDGVNSSDDDVGDADDMEDGVGDIEQPTPLTEPTVSFSGNGDVLVAAEVANQDAGALEERIRQRIFEKAVKAEVVTADSNGEDDSRSKSNDGNRWLYIGGIVLVAMIIAIVVIVVLLMKDSGDAADKETPVTGGRTQEPSMAPIKTSQPTGPTSSPTTMAFFESEQVLIAELGSVLDTEKLSDTTSPVSKAFQWLLTEDQFSTTTNTELRERYVLTLFYISTVGEEWDDQLELSTTGHCTWGGLNETSTVGIDCDSNSRLTEIVFERQGLKGAIPSEIQYLTELRVLDLDSNDLTGTIPSEIGLLIQLSDLDLSHNEIEGTIPSSLFELKNLLYLELHNNSLQGPIPTNVGNCIRLMYLLLEENKLNGQLPESVSDLVSLQFLDLSNNIGLSGPLPSFSNNRNLLDLDLSENSFTSTIPSTIFGNSKLSSLSLYGNALGGKIPTEATQMTEMMYFDLFENVLTGTIPVFSGTPNMLSFDVEKNQLRGDINGLIHGSMPLLEYVRLNDNLLTGSIPEAIVDHLSITDLYLQRCEFSGTLPTTLGLLLNLEHLEVQSNSWTGQLPSEIGILTKLTMLDVCCGNFTNALPNEWSALSNLQSLYVEENSLTGMIPPSPSWNATTFPDLTEFWSHENDFTGDLSPGFCDGETGFLSPILVSLATDCLGPAPEVNCTCCVQCCDSNDDCEGF
uniref:L domain-like protein n=1 Tax=Grammatophora oceanica TaxID=210454 RepID=A0A7S1V5Y3_9STRA|mmetsp:Transcript_36030/g.53681  ORF Transcript_36030/g.53681 Transcript_36030/m.53681 type:complete len:885 (+) Transcript_36030:165-2819(+)